MADLAVSISPLPIIEDLLISPVARAVLEIASYAAI
jgi:hypothetical protein